MTRSPRSDAPLLRRASVAVAAIAATLTATVTMVAPTTAAAATEATSSTTIASSANHALWLLVRWEQTGTLAAYTDYLAARGVVARATAAEFGISAELLESTWAMAQVDNQHILMAAMSQLGVAYRSQMSKENRGFDCSGLVFYAYSHAGIPLPRSSGQQIAAGDEVELLEADAGDLVYYPGHISIYLGAGLLVHSPQPGESVEVRPLFDRRLRFSDATHDVA